MLGQFPDVLLDRDRIASGPASDYGLIEQNLGGPAEENQVIP
jgi:hypothetical protein